MSETNTSDTISWSDTDAMNDLAFFINAPGQVNGADLVDRVTLLLEATGRTSSTTWPTTTATASTTASATERPAGPGTPLPRPGTPLDVPGTGALSRAVS